jgi:hypothetical protein
MAAFVLPASQSLLSFPFGVGILAVARRSLTHTGSHAR